MIKLAVVPKEIKQEAKRMYENGALLIDISREFDIAEGTIRSWKNRDKWKCNATKATKESKDMKCNVARKEKQRKQEEKVIARQVESVMSNSELNDKQKLFCLYYSKSFNATQSYLKAYNSSYITASTNCYKLLAIDKIRDEIVKLKEQRYSMALLKPEDIFQKYLEIAYSDITSFTTFGCKTRITCDEYGNETETVEGYVNVNESEEVDGTLISEISQGKEGTKLKLLDKMKALEWLTNHMNMATDEQKARLDNIKAQTSRLQGSEDVAELDRLDEVLESIKGVV